MTQEYAIRRILEKYDILIPYFTELCKRDPTTTHDMILTELKKLANKIYLEFLAYSLNLFNEFNTVFQSELPLLHVLQSKTEELVETLALNYLQEDYVRSFANVMEIDPIPSAEENFLPDSEIYMGTLNKF